MAKRVLAFDFGASSGRAMLGEFDGEKISLTEAHRFDNNPVMVRNTFYWDVLNLLFEIKQGITKARALGDFSTIGIDTWGVDFGLLDQRGDLLENPVHYRDLRTSGMVEEVCGIVGRDRLYEATGNQFMELNTIFQLYALAKGRPEVLKRADCALLMPDLLGYFLTGVKTAEYSIASTTQMMNAHTKKWEKGILEQLGIPGDLFPEIVKSGTVLGPVSGDICKELGIQNVDVVSVAGHDTACAVVAAPATEDDFIYISCGTWSLFGTETQEPIIGEKSMKYNITNEGGYNYTTRFLKNIMGLWMIQSVRKELPQKYSYAELCRMAEEVSDFPAVIDVNDAGFLAPGSMIQAIQDYCRAHGQAVPETPGEIATVIYQNLGRSYGETVREIEELTGKTYDKIHVVGGGSNADYLNELTARYTKKEVLAGPGEATAIGNVAVQMIAAGELKDIWDARSTIRNSFEIRSFQA